MSGTCDFRELESTTNAIALLMRAEEGLDTLSPEIAGRL